LFLARRLRQGGALRQAHDIALDGNPRNGASGDEIASIGSRD